MQIEPQSRPMLAKAKAVAWTFSLLLLALCTQQHGPASKFAKNRYVMVTVQVVDDATYRPVREATIQVVCMGGTPFEKRQYQTDECGMVQIMSFEMLSPLTVKGDGFKDGFALFVHPNGIPNHGTVKLQRKEG